MKYAVTYSSKTGNTSMLAYAIQKMLPEGDCIYYGNPLPTAAIADRIYVGFWTNQGTCDEETKEFLKTLKCKEVFLFGTAGFGGEQSYFDQIINSVERFLDSSVKVIGSYMCQGKMPMSVRQRYEQMLESPNHMPNLEAMIENFDQALKHPDMNDLTKLVNLIDTTI